MRRSELILRPYQISDEGDYSLRRAWVVAKVDTDQRLGPAHRFAQLADGNLSQPSMV
jgi:hypothetical protein